MFKIVLNVLFSSIEMQLFRQLTYRGHQLICLQQIFLQKAVAAYSYLYKILEFLLIMVTMAQRLA